MTLPVTEIALLPVKDGADIRSVMIDASTTLVTQPGNQRVRWGTEAENPNHLRMFIDWDSKEAHEKFIADPEYGPFLQRLGAIIDGAPVLYHVPFDNFPPNVLSNELPEEKGGKGKTGVAEVLHAYFPVDYSTEKQEKAIESVKEFVKASLPNAKGYSGESALGFAIEELDHEGEKAKVLVAALGWDSIDAHMAFRETDDFKNNIGSLRGLPELKGLKVFHVSSHVFEKTG